jgi:hypothetical protein
MGIFSKGWVNNMALMNCPECKKEISSGARRCPHCGCNVKKVVNEKSVTPSGYVGCLVVILILAIAFAWYTNQTKDEPGAYTFDKWVQDGMPSGE